MVIYWSLRKFSRLPLKNMFLYIRRRLPRLLFQFIKHTFKIPLQVTLVTTDVSPVGLTVGKTVPCALDII